MMVLGTNLKGFHKAGSVTMNEGNYDPWKEDIYNVFSVS